MKAYKELSKELGHQELQKLKFPEVKHYEPGGEEASLAGKMKTRPKHSHRKYQCFSNSNTTGLPYTSSSLMIGHTEYVAAKKLREAASDGTFEEVLDLVRSGANVKKQDSKGRTALHFASSRGASDVVHLLIQHGASVNERDCNGSTPLHLGTDVNALDSRGVTPLHLAYSRLRLARESDDRGGQALSRKKEMYGIVDMLREYLLITKSDRDETEELEELAGRLSLSDTSEEVGEIQSLLAGFTSLSIQKRGQQLSSQHTDSDKHS